MNMTEQGYYDIHCHILPGLDDGAANMDTAIKMLRQEYEDGVRTIYATPHYRTGMFEPSKNKVLVQYKLIKEQAEKIGEGIRILPGCEFHVSMDMIPMLEAGIGTTMGDSRCVLTEFSESHSYNFIRERCYALKSHAFQPIIAHAERYPALNKDPEIVASLVEMGVYIQINAESILGKNGFFTKRFCRKIMEWDLLHFIGSDAHDMMQRKPMIGQCTEYLEKKMGQDYVKKILMEHPHKLIEEGR